MSELFDQLPNAQAKRQAAAERARQRRRRKLRTMVVTFVAVALLAMSSVIAWPHVKTLLDLSGTAAADYEGEGSGEVIVTIPEGSTGRDIAQILLSNRVVASERAFIDAFNNDKRAASIQAGSYKLKQNMSAVSALAGLLDPDSRAEISVTIPEGFTAAQISARLVKVMGYDAADVDNVLADPAAIGLPQEAGGKVEGWLSPVTYTFAPDTTPKEALSAMVSQRVSELNSMGLPREKWQRTIIVGSIVEREVNWPDYYGQVARVIENRLTDTSQVNGRLQMDSTVLYGVGKSGGVPTKEEIEADTPYNTYRNAGLPPTPISNPSAAVIAASANPPQGDWLYFVTVNLETGETKFANNLDEHNTYVGELRQWVADHPGQAQSSGASGR
ncbi:endolytic transglycosylase MltG [Trueperella pecoris]|uniref:Endolytic murein transglycosylase n=1 Tax=Trueperella pecoris TaxID=2733571 RepID=A0A7M1QWP8_9ACTO|nr:endolytic transglycosylase MltG [Trueperella pecoris]QOR46512.1 endolytic transglycosylase MltG [Trueperella pecoris]QTG76338.1 endolytic transglycosylase MltG [Trueperella pecoris]